MITDAELLAVLPRVKSYTLKLLKGSSGMIDADDLIQDVIVIALSKQHLFREGSNLANWILTITHNVFINTIRRNNTRKYRHAVDIHDETEVKPHENLIVDGEQERHQIIVKELTQAFEKANLRKEQIEAIKRVANDEFLTYEEHAKELNLNISTFRTRLHRGREKLKEVYYA